MEKIKLSDIEEIEPLQIIDKDRAIEALRNYGEGIADANVDKWTMQIACKIIEKIPTAKVVPAKRMEIEIRKRIELEKSVHRGHGHWKRPVGAGTSSYRYECSHCGKVAYQVTGNCGRKYKDPNPKCTYEYCPNCGARMDEEVEK